MKNLFKIMLLGLVITAASCEDKTEEKENTTDQPKVEKDDHILDADTLDTPPPNQPDNTIPTDSAAVDSL